MQPMRLCHQMVPTRGCGFAVFVGQAISRQAAVKLLGSLATHGTTEMRGE